MLLEQLNKMLKVIASQTLNFNKYKKLKHNLMSKKIYPQDFNFKTELQKSIDAYIQATIYDDFLFGDYDYEYFWLEQETNDIY